MEEAGAAPSQADRSDTITWERRGHMPNIKSAKKRVRVTRVRTLRNKIYRSELKTTIKKFLAAVSAGDKAAAEAAYIAAVKKVDKASARGIIHKNKAARKKSQFTKMLNSLG